MTEDTMDTMDTLETLDIAAVAADDAAVEGLRALTRDATAAVVWGDDGSDEEPDEVLRLLGLLVGDVSRDLPRELKVQPLTSPTGTATVIPLTVASARGRRTGRRSVAVLGVAAAVLSVAGAAAASSGNGLTGLGHSMARAVAGAVDAITPQTPIGPRLQPQTSQRDNKSMAAGRAAGVLLDRAQTEWDAGRVRPATALLAAACRRVPDMVAGDGRALLTERCDRLAALMHPGSGLATSPGQHGRPTSRPVPAATHKAPGAGHPAGAPATGKGTAGKGTAGKGTAGKGTAAKGTPGKGTAGKGTAGKGTPASRTPKTRAPLARSTGAPAAKPATPRPAHSAAAPDATGATGRPRASTGGGQSGGAGGADGGRRPAQPSSEASAKPRA